MHHVVRLSEHSLSCINAFDWDLLEERGPGKGGRREGEAEERRLSIKRSLSCGRKRGYVTAFEGRSQFGRWKCTRYGQIGGLCFIHISWGYLHLWRRPILFLLILSLFFLFLFLFPFLFLFLFFFYTFILEDLYNS